MDYNLRSLRVEVDTQSYRYTLDRTQKTAISQSRHSQSAFCSLIQWVPQCLREPRQCSSRVFGSISARLSHGMAALGAWTRAATLMVVADRRGRCCASMSIARWPRAPMVHCQRRQLRPMVQTAVDGSPPIHLTADGCTPRLDTCHESRMLLPRCPVNAFRVHST